MIWRVGDRFVVTVGTAFWEIDSTGAIVVKHAPSDWSYEDTLAKSRVFVEDGRLREESTIDRWSADKEEITTVVLIEGLRPDDSAETRRFVATVLGDHDVVQEEERIRDEREAEARVDEIEGARDRFDHGVSFDRAQHELVERVRRWGDSLAARLLRTLIDLGRTRPSRASLRAYVRACLLACFDPAPEPIDGEPVRSVRLADVQTLVAGLEATANQQDDADAPGNAALYRQAADAMREAARLLGG